MCTFKRFQVLTVCTQVDSEAGVPQMAAEELLLEGVWAEVEWGGNSTSLLPPPHTPTATSGAQRGISQTVVHPTFWAWEAEVLCKDPRVMVIVRSGGCHERHGC